MASKDVLVDSSFLIALNDLSDDHTLLARLYMEKNWRRQIIPDVVLTEVAYMLRVNIGQNAVLNFLDEMVAPQVSLQSLIPADLVRAREIMSTYFDSRLDFVDCCIMALSERLEVTRVCTFDHRDFATFRPKHCDYLELLP